jgi:OOP family OmpA-OmpF porin
MKDRRSIVVTAFAGLIALSMLTAGCATKKYVSNQLDPLEARLGKLDEKTSDNQARITEVDQKSERGIAEAKDQARDAAGKAGQAGEKAQAANQLAQQGLSEVELVRQDLQNIQNFQPLKTETVLFGFNRSDLTDEDKQQLDALVKTIAEQNRYFIEVQGYADATGSDAYNLELSRRRAEAVVRYLTMVHKIPLVRVFTLGYGEDSPVAENRTREGREQNRRVEVRMLVPTQTSAQAAGNPTTAETSSK